MAQVTADMLISEVLTNYPGAASVFERYGLGCAACMAAGMESLSAVASVHDVPLAELLADLDRLADESPGVPRKEN